MYQNDSMVTNPRVLPAKTRVKSNIFTPCKGRLLTADILSRMLIRKLNLSIFLHLLQMVHRIEQSSFSLSMCQSLSVVSILILHRITRNKPRVIQFQIKQYLRVN